MEYKEIVKEKEKKIRQISTSQFIIFGFMIAIVIGTVLLMLPVSSQGKSITNVVDALFTATSATCVTGLVVHDTATYWSTFGQAVIIILIQIGGMGVITIAVSLTMLSGRKIGLRQRILMQEAISAPRMGGIIKFTGFIVKVIFMVEVLAALAMFPVFYKEFGFVKGIWYSIFHSISAFCNAGFDLMGVKGEYSSLTTLSGSKIINIIIMFMIIFGGLGFTTWEDIKEHKFNLKKYKMQSKVIFTVTLVLIIVPALYFYFCEFSKEAWNGMSSSEKIMDSFFSSVTTRTAGFSTVDLSKLTGAGQWVMILLMLIGGAPGSTAGGMKVTTIAVIFASAFAVFRKKQETRLFKRRIETEIVATAATILLMYIFLFMISGIAISNIEGLPITSVLFETSSAIATVGLSLGLTPDFCVASKIILIILMFCGRVGGLTIIFATVTGKSNNLSKLPKEKIMVG